MAGSRPQLLTISSVLCLILGIASIVLGVSTVMDSPIIAGLTIASKIWLNLSGVLLFFGAYGNLVGSYWTWYLMAFLCVFEAFAGIEYMIAGFYILGIPMFAISALTLYAITRDQSKEYFL